MITSYKFIENKNLKINKIHRSFFSKDAEIVAKNLIGKILVRKINNKEMKAIIIETEAYYDEKDPSSWARFGKRRDNIHMWNEAGIILVKNVHKYLMLNFVTGKKGIAEAVLIRAGKPLNFEAKTSGPGLLTSALKIDKTFNGKFIDSLNDFWIEENNLKNNLNEKNEKNKTFEIKTSKRIGVKKDLDKNLRFMLIE